MKFSVVIPLLLILVSFSGCQNNSDAGARGRGVVTFNGTPLQEGLVMFIPASKGGAAAGPLNSEGRFELKTGASLEGVKPGDYIVTVSSWEIMPGDVRADGTEDMKGKSRIPRHYNDKEKSGLTATVTEQGPNEFTFALEGEGEK